jgi:ATP-dependent RNA helicase DBP3
MAPGNAGLALIQPLIVTSSGLMWMPVCSGLSHTFFSGASDKARAGELINVLKEANQEVPEELLKFGTTVKRKDHKLFGAHYKEVDFTKKATKVSFDSDDE